MSRCGRSVKFWCGKAGGLWQVLASSDQAMRGKFWLGKAGKVRQGTLWWVKAWFGEVRTGKVWHGLAAEARQVPDSYGMAGLGAAGMVNCGESWPGRLR